MTLLNHIENLKHEIETLYLHGDVKDVPIDILISLEAAEYHVDKLLQILIRTRETQ